MELSSKSINKCETYHMLRRDIAASALQILCENVDPVKSYGKININVFVLRTGGA